MIHACWNDNLIPLDLVLRKLDWIEFVERDRKIIKINQVESDAPWALSRLESGNQNSAGGKFQFNGTGSGVTIYILDTGVVDHKEFGGRVSIVYSAFGANTLLTSDSSDLTGHGTHVTGLAIGTNVGVAKLAQVAMLQVISDDGTGMSSNVVGALEWISKNAQKPCLINMSLAGTKSPALDDAVQKLIAQGILVIAAAGNQNSDACSYSPAGLNSVVTVGAIDQKSNRASFSNYGKCVSIFAPGDKIISSGPPGKTNNVGYWEMSGSSMAAPLVAGVAATILEANPMFSPLDIIKVLGEISGAFIAPDTLNGSPNVLLQAYATGPSPPLVKLSSIPITQDSQASITGLDWTIYAAIIAIVVAITLLVYLIIKIISDKKAKEEKMLKRKQNYKKKGKYTTAVTIDYATLQRNTHQVKVKKPVPVKSRRPKRPELANVFK